MSHHSAQATPSSAPADQFRKATPGLVEGSGKDVALALLIGLLGGLFGLLPWLISGAQLPLQNLWATPVTAHQMPLSLLPLSQYEATALVALMTTGGAAAGLAVRWWSPARRRTATGCAAAGVVLVQVYATVQAFTVMSEGLAPGPLSRLYVAGLQAGVTAAIAASLMALLLVAAPPRALATLGIGLVAVPFVSWMLAGAGYVAGIGNIPVELTTLGRWLPAVLVGAALVWCGLRPSVHALAWLADLGLLWVVPALFTAVQSVLGTRVLGGNLEEMAAMGKSVLLSALGSAEGAGPVLLALALALTVLFAQPRALRRGPGRALQ